MTVYSLKPAFQKLLRPACRELAQRGVTANQVTLSAVGLSVATGALLALFPSVAGLALLIPAVLLARMALNALDGMLAREHGMQTRLGAILNELGDVVSDAALYLPFARVPGIWAPWVVLVVLLALLTEMTGVLAIQAGGHRRYDGPMGKSDRALVFSALALLIGSGVEAGTWANLALVATSGFLVWTIYNRAERSLREPAGQARAG